MKDEKMSKLTEWTTTSFYSAPDFKDKYWRVTSYKDFKSPKLAHDFIEVLTQNEKLRKLIKKELESGQDGRFLQELLDRSKK